MKRIICFITLTVMLLLNSVTAFAAGKSTNTWFNISAGVDKYLYDTEINYDADSTKGYIYLGDSRFVGMNSAVDIESEENTFVVAKVGKGYKWLIDYADDEINSIISEHKDITDWILISGLGVNDLRNIDKYIEYYDSIESMQVILLSVNPVDKAKCDRYGYDYAYLSREMVRFNEKLQETDYPYIDTYSLMIDEGFTTRDGVHYTNETYSMIYDEIQDYIAEMQVLNIEE